MADFAKTVPDFFGCPLVQVTKMVLRAVPLVLPYDFGPGLFLLHILPAFQSPGFLGAKALKNL